MSILDNELAGHLVKAFLDVIVLNLLKNEASHGYKMIADIHTEYNVLLSPGTLYPLLYSLHKENLVSVETEKRKKIYTLTEKGEKRLEYIKIKYETYLRKIFEMD